jgi:uncharacterized repeat protein (TIGR03803 family)
MRRELTLVAGHLVVVLASAAGLSIPSAQAQTLSVVHNFSGGSDGSNPQNGFLVGSTGALYGTTSSGGASNLGVVFKLSGKSRIAILHDFTGGADGATPNGSVIEDASEILYGTTTAGGATGNGTVFRLKGKKESVLYSFAGGTDGADPQSGLVKDAAGNLYGTTSAGGSAGNGTVFELVAPQGKNGTWTEKLLYSFGSGTDGVTPIGGVIFDAAGNLYGTTSAGGASSYGTVFELSPGAAWTETILHNFQNASDGGTPYAGLIADAAGNMYGAATDGGVNGGGSIFELTPSGGSWNFSAIGSEPGYGISGTFRNLLIDSSGNIYGTTHCDGNYGAGTIYELTPAGGGSWTYNPLYNFTGGGDGLFSISNLVIKNRKLYGTTLDGGTNDAGVIFELTP